MPRKLGQHFLSSAPILQQISDAIASLHPERIVEIGPGRGALTRYLLGVGGEIHAVELDDRLAAFLSTHFASHSHLHIHHGDVLTTDLAQWGPAVIAGNLPYYITSPIVERFLQLDSRFPAAVFLMQWEVAQRLLAKPHSRDYGYLTVATQTVCKVELVCKIPASAFSPPPKVESAAVLLRRRPEVVPDLPALLEFVGRCFTHKRKNLRNNLRAFYGAAIDTMPEATLRAEQLELSQFAELRARLRSKLAQPEPVL